MTLIIFLFILFFYLAGRHERKRNNKNPYITRHEKKIAHDTNYAQYEKWCLKKGEIPANKESFIKDVEQKEAFIKDLYK